MASITLQGNEIHTIGDLPNVGRPGPDFLLTKTDLSDVKPSDFSGKRIVLNIFPSIDTPVCAMSVRKFNELASSLNNTLVLCVSKDLPFAHARFCGAEGLENVISASEMRNHDFGDRYGVRMIDGPMAGLLARSIVILDESGTVVYGRLAPEIKEEPDYDSAVSVLK